MAELILLTIVIEYPGIKLREMQVQLKDYGIEVSESTIFTEVDLATDEWY